MLHTHRVIAFCLLLFATLSSRAQVEGYDSLRQVAYSEASDSLRMDALKTLCKRFMSHDIDSFRHYAEETVNYANAWNLPLSEQYGYNMWGVSHAMREEFGPASRYFVKTAELAAINGDTTNQMAALTNLANIHRMLDELEEAAAYYERSLEFALAKNDSAIIGVTYENLGLMLQDLKRYDEAKAAMRQAVLFLHPPNDHYMLAWTALSIMHQELGELDSATMCLIEAGPLVAACEQPSRLRFQIAQVGLFSYMNDHQTAIAGAKNLLDSVPADNRWDKRRLYDILRGAYAQLGDYENAYLSNEQYWIINESIQNDNTKSEVQKERMNFEFSMTQLEQKLKADQEDERKRLEQEAADQRTSFIMIGLIGGVALLAILALVLYRNFRQKQKISEVLSEKNTLITEQKELVEEKNKEITDSINYASRIQNSILPPNDQWQRLLPDSFVLYLPKDIVSGDFYWIDQHEDKVLFAAVDCTGHGVPGAMMSVVGLNLLQDAVHDRGLHHPGEILSHLDDGVHKTLRQTEQRGVKDGMDLGVCSLNLKTRKLEYAGAYNPLYIVRNGKLEQTKADKLPIGMNYDGAIDQYTNHEFDLQPGDCVYLLTDGYPDQFGGPKGKKFMYRPLREMLASMHDVPMVDQHKKLLEAFQQWRGDLEQVDDVCLIGVRV